MLSTCRVLVKNLKGSEFNVPVSETARLENIFMSRFLKKEMAPQKVMSLFVGIPSPEIIMYLYRCLLGPSSETWFGFEES